MVEIPGFRARREAREDALTLLYEVEIVGNSSSEALADRPVGLSKYAVEIVLGVERNLNHIDDAVRRHLFDWRLERLAVVDRTLARIATWELVNRPDVPTGVVLSEAVELATQYCGAESPRFLNGVLRAVADEVRALALPLPQLAGKLTRMRMWKSEDAPTLAAAWQDPLIQQHLPVPQPADEPAAGRWIEQRGRTWTERSSLDLAVTDPKTGAVIGEVGLSHFDKNHRAALVGWWVLEGWRGQGRASEAVKLLVDWILSEHTLAADQPTGDHPTDGHPTASQIDVVMAEIHTDNRASERVARNAGLRRIDAAHPDPARSHINVFARSRTSD